MATSGRLPNSAHTSRDWRIGSIATPAGFKLEDVWALPTPGGPEDFPLLIENFATGNPDADLTGPAGWLWALRWKLGEIFGWDDEGSGTDSRVTSLRERLPDDLRAGPRGPDFGALPFDSLYMLEDEWAAEIANGTMHGVMHMGWVRDGDVYRGEMAVYVKTNGLFGRAYMAAIKPFRYLIVYPAVIRQMEAEWSSRKDAAGSRRAPALG